MKRIIIVDDDPAIRDAFFQIFNSEEYEVTIYPDGSPVLNRTFAIPDLFILDKQLSGIDGIDLCRILKEQTATKHVPVIMLSASPNIKLLANAAGADEVLEKPFRIKTLLESVGRLLEKDGSAQK